MADVLGKAILEISTDTKDIKAALADLRKDMHETAESAHGIEQAVNLEMFKEFAKLGVEALKTVVEGIIELGKRGTEVNDVAESFDQLAERAHSTGTEMLGALRSGTQGTISDFNLMKLSSAALATGLIKTSADMETLSQGAFMLAKRTGGDAKEAFDTLTKAVETGRTAHLKSLGLFVDTKVAVAEYAASIGKGTKDLNDHEKATALSIATLAKLREEFKDKAPLDFGDAVAQLVTRLENFRDQLAGAVAMSPVLMAGLRALAPAFTEAFGGNSQGLIKTVVGLINDFAIFLVNVARAGVWGAEQIINMWTLLKVSFNGLMYVVVGGWELMAKAAELALRPLLAFPGPMGAAFRSVSASVKSASEELEAMRKSFGAQTGEALDGAAAQKAALDKVDGALAVVVGAMHAAEGATAAATKAKKEFGKAANDAGALAAKNAQKIAAEELKLQGELELAGRVGMDRRIHEIKNAMDKELLMAHELTGGIGAEYEKLRALITEKYRQQTMAAMSGADQIRDATRSLHQYLAQSTMTGIQLRLAQLADARAKEMQGIENLKQVYADKYAELAALIKQKYDQMAAVAQGFGLTTMQLAAQAGFKSREELQRTAAIAIETYERMKESGIFNANQLRDAFIAAENARRLAAGETVKFQKATMTTYADAFSSTLSALAGKSKAAALAGGVIDLAKAELMTFRTYGWPAALPFMALLAAAGAAQMAKISSAKYALGTPGLDFADFGAMSPVELHNQEAVIPKGRGHQLAGEVAAALPGNGMDMSGVHSRLDRIASGLDGLPRMIKRAMRDARMP